MSGSKVAAGMAAVVCMSAVGAQSALAAQDNQPVSTGTPAQNESVTSRARPDFDPVGLRVGSFTFYPSTDLAANFDDNIFRTNDAKSDWILTVSPSARLKSNWRRHYLELYAGLNYCNYLENKDQNLVDWNVGADGILNISNTALAKAHANFGQFHEFWSSVDADRNAQAAPNRYWQAHGDVTASYQPNQLGVEIGGAIDRYNWTRTPRNLGGFLYNDDRDNTEYQAYSKVYYDFAPGYAAFIKASYDERDYDRYFDRSGLHRGSHGYRLDGGVELQVTHLIAGEIYAGYLKQDFSSPYLKDVSGFDYGAQLDWYVMPVLTAHLSGRRVLNNVALNGVSVSDDRGVMLSADYEFRRDVIIHAYGSYTNSRYVGSSRSDGYPGAGVGVSYLVNRYMSLDANYNYSSRTTRNLPVEFTDSLFSIGLKVHL